MNQRRPEELLLSNRRLHRKGSPSDRFFCNFNVSSLLSSVDCDSLNDARFGYPLKTGESETSKPRDSFVNYLSAQFVDQTRAGKPRRQAPLKNAVIRRGGARRMVLRAGKASLGDIYRSSESTISFDKMMRTGQVDHLPGSKPVVDISIASTSGRVGGEFWNERRIGRCSFDYLPVGTLYKSQKEDGIPRYCELPQGKTLEENVEIDENHSVSTGFQQGKQVDERSIWLSTSHKLGVNHVVATQFTNDLNGGNNFNVNSTHNFIRDSTLSTNFYTNCSGECSLEVELQREKRHGNQEVLESIMTNLRTGERLLKLQSRSVLRDIVFLNSIVSDLRAQHTLRFMATAPVLRTGFFSSSLATDSSGSQKFCVNSMQKIHNQVVIGASFTTNLKHEDSLSLEAKHQLGGKGNLGLKLTNYHQGLIKWDVTTSLTTKRNSWLWTYRDFPNDGRSLGCEWRHEVSPDHFFSIQAAAKHWSYTISSEICIPC